MDVTEAIETRLEIREYADEPVDGTTRRAILEAGRLAPSGRNHQHWAFLLVDGDGDLSELAALSTTGAWIEGADFAVVVCIDPDYDYHAIDAGRAVIHMQFAAWEHGVGSCIYTGYDEAGTREFLAVPDRYDVTLVAGFGYPVREVRGRKRRRPLDEIAHGGRFGAAIGPVLDGDG